MSKLEVDKIDPQSGTDLELGTSGDTITIPTGVTLDASNATTTLPANVVTTDGSQTLTNKSIDASQLTGTITPSDGTVTNAKVNASAAIDYSKLNLTGNIALADLSATGTKDATTFLRGDNTFATVTSGLTIVDVWRLTADVTSNGVITSNLEQPDTDGATTIGSSMSQSSGIFTFPETGKYMIICQGLLMSGGGVGDDTTLQTQTTTDGTNYGTAAIIRSDVPDSNEGDTGSSFFLFDVTNTTTHKVRFNVADISDGGSRIKGDTSLNATAFIFQKLGDT